MRLKAFIIGVMLGVCLFNLLAIADGGDDRVLSPPAPSVSTSTPCAHDSAEGPLAGECVTTSTTAAPTTTAPPTTVAPEPRASRSRESVNTSPRPVNTTTPNYAASDVDGILAAIKRCESGGNYSAQNRTSSASGAYQFLDSTWAGRGGFESAKDAPPEMQDQAARELYAASGTRPWNASKGCWG